MTPTNLPMKMAGVRLRRNGFDEAPAVVPVRGRTDGGVLMQMVLEVEPLQFPVSYASAGETVSWLRHCKPRFLLSWWSGSRGSPAHRQGRQRRQPIEDSRLV